MKLKWANGIYKFLPFDEYKGIDAVNASSLKEIDQSPLH